MSESILAWYFNHIFIYFVARDKEDVQNNCNKAIPVTSRRSPMGFETLKFPHFVDSRLTDGGKVVSLTRRPHLNPPSPETFLVLISRWTNCFRPLQHCDRGFESHWGMDVCVCFSCFYIVSSETASRPNKRLHWISLFMSYIKVSKLAYRIWVILIANERVKKRNFSLSKP
jgi:hypothetical protein